MNMQVIDFKEVKNSPCLGYAVVEYGNILFHIKLMYRKESGLFIDFPRGRQKEGWVHCCWVGERDSYAEFQLTMIRQLTDKYPDAKRVIHSKLKKVVQ